MLYRSITLIAALALTPLAAHASEQEPPPPPITSPIDPYSRSLAAQIVDLGYPEENREALFFGTMDQTVKQMRTAIAPSLPNDDPGALAILDTWILDYTAQSKEVLRKHIPDIMNGMVEAYAELFTPQELTDILAFVETTSGQRYFELSPAILGSKSFADANQAYLDESLSMLGPAQADLQERLQEYMLAKSKPANPADT